MNPGETVLSGAPKVPGISEFKVMRSAAGWYIGTDAPDPECGGAVLPYSRESGYFPTEEAAEAALATWGDGGSFEGART